MLRKSREEILKDFKAQIAQGKILVGVGAGTGITAKCSEAADVDILITFGEAESDPRAEAWMKDPDRAYPEARTEWGTDEIHLNAVFLPGYGLTAVPFPDFATYAFTLDEGRRSGVRRDPRPGRQGHRGGYAGLCREAAGKGLHRRRG